MIDLSSIGYAARPMSFYLALPGEDASEVTITSFDDELIDGWAVADMYRMAHIKRNGTSDSHNDLKAAWAYYLDLGGNVFTAINNRMIIGAIALRPADRRTGVIQRFAVLPEFQCKGVGTALIATLVDWATVRDFDRLTLMTSDTDGVHVRRLFEWFGFRAATVLGTEGVFQMDLGLHD